MGQNLSSLPSPFGSDPSLRVNVDFKGAPPATSQGTAECVSECATALAALGSYEPKPAPIREAISKPQDMDIAMSTVVALLGNVDTINGWMVLSDVVARQLLVVSANISKKIASGGGGSIADFPGDTAALATLLHFCWKFDQGKMMQPGILNDFAGYRRVVGKVAMKDVPGMTVDEAATGTISMWAADMAPFTSKGTNSITSARAVLCALANCCCGMVGRAGGAAEGGGFGGAPPAVGSVQWLLEVMVAAIVFFDRACVSAFDSKELQIRRCIAAIKKHGGPGRESLLNSLKYSTKNFNAAPAPIQGLLE